MNPRHPPDDILLQHAAGRLGAGASLVLSAHLEGCAECRARLRLLDAVGGALIEEIEPQPLSPQAWARTLERIDTPPSDGGAPRPPAAGADGIVLARPGNLPAWPRALRGCRATGWNWMGPGMRYARLTLRDEQDDGRLFLLRISPGRSLPRHTHDGLELTQVLCGSFDDGRSLFEAGDFDATDHDVHHQPIVQEGGECVCLAYVGGRLQFDGRIAAAIGGWVGM